jgi:hypothetical protein
VSGINDPRWVAKRGIWKAWCSLCDWSIETESKPACERQVRFHEDGYRHRRRESRVTTR